MKATHRYDDIIHLPHHVSPKRPHMPLEERAAQFSPFAALTGYDEAVRETARLTDRKPELTEEEKLVLDEKLRRLAERLDERPRAVLTVFVPDEWKAGGSFLTLTGSVKKLDALEGVLTLEDGTAVSFADILALEEAE